MNYNLAGKIIKWCWIVALVGVAVFNVQPYLQFTRSLSLQGVTMPFSGLVEPIPLAGDLVKLLGVVLPDIVTVAIFGVLQGLQCLPMLLANPNVVRARIAAGETWQHLPIKDADPKWLKELKERLNNFPLKWIEDIHAASKVAYFVDVVFGAIKYPLFVKGWVHTVENWNSLDLGSVQWVNVPAFLIMLFAMEFAIWIYLKLCEGVDVFNGGRTPQPQPSPQTPDAFPMSW